MEIITLVKDSVSIIFLMTVLPLLIFSFRSQINNRELMRNLRELEIRTLDIREKELATTIRESKQTETIGKIRNFMLHSYNTMAATGLKDYPKAMESRNELKKCMFDMGFREVEEEIEDGED